MGSYGRTLEKRMRDHHRDKVIATAALCGCKFISQEYPDYTAGWPGVRGKVSTITHWSWEGNAQQYWMSQLAAAKAFIKAKGIQVDYGFSA
jgi:hypothetical protein